MATNELPKWNTEAIARAMAEIGEAFRRTGRRLRRRAARRVVSGRRGTRSVGPWGMPWFMVGGAITEDEAQSIEAGVVGEQEGCDDDAS